MSKAKCVALGSAFLTATLVSSTAAADYDESVSGDLSSNAAAPTPLSFVLGSNTLSGTVRSPADARDYVTFTIPPGRYLAALRLWVYEDLPSGSPGNTGFHAINAGATSFVPSTSTASSFLGGAHLDPVAAGTDLLPMLAGAAQAGTGFGLLGPGTYSYVVQQTSALMTGYEVEFVFSAGGASQVPLMPGGYAVIAGGLLAGATLLVLRRRRLAT